MKYYEISQVDMILAELTEYVTGPYLERIDPLTILKLKKFQFLKAGTCPKFRRFLI